MSTVRRVELPGVPPSWDAAQVADQAAEHDPAAAIKATLRRIAPTLIEELSRLALDAKDDKVRLAAISKLLDLSAGVGEVRPQDPLVAFLRKVDERED